MDQDFVRKYEVILGEIRFLSDIYMLDYFVENTWVKLPQAWQEFFEKQLEEIGNDRQKVIQFVKWILRKPGHPSGFRHLKTPEPLSMIVLRNLTHEFSVKSWQPLEKPSDFLSIVGLDGETSSEGDEFMDLKTVLPPALRLKIKNKKEHEIERIVSLVLIILEKLNNTKVDEIVDIGAGIGHLSRVLSLLLPDKTISTIEGDADFVEKAVQIDKKVSKNNKHLNKNHGDEKNWNPLQRKVLFVKEQHEIGDSEGKNLLLTGLHTCGDFSTTILRHFVSNPDAKILLHFGCCYHKINNGSDRLYRDFYGNDEKNETAGFPISRSFQTFQLSYAAREIACFGHEQFLQKLEQSLDKKTFFVNCYRAILEWIILGCPKSPTEADPELRHKGLRGFRGAESMDFWQYSEAALRDNANLRQTFSENVEKRSNLEQEVVQMVEQHATKTLILYTLRLLIAPIVETIILLDRQAFLMENGVKECFLFPLFRPVLSPRNMALFAWKG